MLLIQIFIIIVLLLISWEDIQSRAVHWFWFPLLAALLIGLQLLQKMEWSVIGNRAMLNLGFIFLQLLLLSVYFSMRQGKWVNLTAALLGWGDVLLWLCIAFYLSVFNYIIFYLASLVVVLFFWLAVRPLLKKSQQIPLAGLQAILFALYLTVNWIYPAFNLNNDDWLISLLV